MSCNMYRQVPHCAIISGGFSLTCLMCNPFILTSIASLRALSPGFIVRQSSEETRMNLSCWPDRYLTIKKKSNVEMIGCEIKK